MFEWIKRLFSRKRDESISWWSSGEESANSADSTDSIEATKIVADTSPRETNKKEYDKN